jgi:hypothetical protein
MDAIDDQRQVPPATLGALEERISAIAVECGIILNDGFAGFEAEAPPDLQHVAEERDYAEAVWPWRRLMAECVNYLSIQSLTFESLLRREAGGYSNFVRASWSLSTKAASDARCVLHLCDHGFVAQASIVARSCIEAIETLAAFTLERDSADSFVAAQTPEEANHAWFALIRKKARRAMDDAFADIVEMDQATVEWRTHNHRLFGALTHPSYLAPMLNMFSDWKDGVDAHPIFPARTVNCIKAFQAIAEACFEYASLLLLTADKARDTDGSDAAAAATPHENVGFFEEDWLDSYASRGHKFFQRLWIFFLQHQEQSPFSLWCASNRSNEESAAIGS